MLLTKAKIPAPAHRHLLVDAGRGVACLGVLVFHSLDTFPSNALSPALQWAKANNLGWLGVHVFFALSGWCIAERLATAWKRSEAVTHFLGDRGLRIFPAYRAAVAFLLIIRLASAPFNRVGLGGLPSGWRWAEIGLLLEPYFDRTPYLLVSATLIYEVGFYALAGLALLLRRKNALNGRALLAVGAIVCVVPWGNGVIPSPWRVLELWPEFFIGMAAWWATRRRDRFFGGGILALLIALNFFWPPHFGGIGRWTAFGTAVLLAFFYSRDGWVMAFLPGRILVWFGTISYSLYLVHLPLVSPLGNIASRVFVSGSDAFFIGWLATLAVAIVVSAAFFYMVELKFERWRKHIFSPREHGGK